MKRGQHQEEKWGGKYGAVIRLWRNAWEEFIPFLDYDVEIRRVLCSTNAIESLNARYRRAVRARGHFPTEQGCVKVPVSGHQESGPDRHRAGPVGDAVEARVERVLDHLQ
jgi:transposase-like protein